MRPTFRADLTCSREEQQGVIFYRIDDPQSQTSFRLYEIEYLIAKKLDGTRTLPEVISAVKGEFNFDITEPDLQRFVNQLESMGFLHGARGEGSSEAREHEAETQVVQLRAPVDDIELESIDATPPRSDLDRAELDRLLRSAFMHVKQGYIVHARDYFLAAKELSPSDERLTKLVNHLEIIGDTSGPAEVEYLWNQARELFPDIADEVGPLDAKSGGPADIEATSPGMRPSTIDDENLRSRVVWFVLLLVVLAAGVGGLIWVVRAAHIFESAARVKVATLEAERTGVFFEAPAITVEPHRELWLTAKAGGPIASLQAKPNDRVDNGALLVTLALPGRQAKKLAKAERGLKRAQAAYEKAAAALEKINLQREQLEAKKAAAEDKLRELRPKSVLGRGGVSKRDLEKWKQEKLAANQELSKLAKKSRKPRAKETKARKRRDAAGRKIRAIEAKLGPRLMRAPFAGMVVDVKATKGATVAAGDELVLLRDQSAVRLRFEVTGTIDVQPGGEAYVAVGGGKEGRAKVLSVEEKGDTTAIGIKLDDPSGGFQSMDPSQFRLVREYVEPAFRVPVGAVVEDEKGAHVFVAIQKRAHKRRIEVLGRDAAFAVIRGVRGSLQGDLKIVTARTDEASVASIVDGSSLEAESSK